MYINTLTEARGQRMQTASSAALTGQEATDTTWSTGDSLWILGSTSLQVQGVGADGPRGPFPPQSLYNSVRLRGMKDLF